MSEYRIKPYSKAVIKLLKGVVENNDVVWNDLLTYQADIQNYISTMGVELIVKKDEGFAFVKQTILDDDKTINLVSRRQYGFEVSVMLVVLRHMLEEFDSNPTLSQATDKYVTAEDIKEETEMFLPASYNKVKFEKELDNNIDKIVDFGFLVAPKNKEGEIRYRIHRIIKEKVTLDDLLDFKKQLMTMIQQTNLFNTDPQVAGFKLDYMEVWNWGTFNDKVYRLNPKGNNSLLTGANASGKSTLIDALLTLLVPLKRQRFYNQSSGVERKGNRTEETYFLGNYGQKQEGDSGVSSLKLRDKNARSVLLAMFTNLDGRVVTIFQVRYYSGEGLRTVYGMA